MMKNIRTITSWGLAPLALSAQVTQAQNLEDLVQQASCGKQTTLAQRSYDSLQGSRRNPQPLRHRSLYHVAILECQR